MIKTSKNGRKRSVTTFEEVRNRVFKTRENLTDGELDLIKAITLDMDRGELDLHADLVNHTYHTIPVSMEQFLEDPYYLGEGCATIFPAVKADLIELFKRPYREVVFTGSIGAAKTYSLSVAVCRILYELSCMISPQRTFGLPSSSQMFIPLISKNLTLARVVMKAAVDEKIKASPYFMTMFPPVIKSEETLFPSNIVLSIGSYGSDKVLGTDILTIALDETNFPPKRKAQQINVSMGQRLRPEHFDIVEKVYTGVVRRIKSRFQEAGGGFPGMVILASSAATIDSFTERKIRKSKNDPDVFVRDNTRWTLKPDSFSGEVFYVLCSTSSLQSKILTEDDYEYITDEYLDANDAFVMDIPIEYLPDFELNLEDSLRDIAGFSTQAVSLFMQRTKTVGECINSELFHPFSTTEWTAGTPGRISWDKITAKFERRLPGGFTEYAFKPALNSRALRWCHIDTSLSGDSSGICIGHIDRWVEVLRRGTDGEKYTDLAPHYIIDFMLRINPPIGEQIYMPDLRAIFYQFVEKGYSFRGFSCDQFQSAETLQQVKRQGIKTRLISMDETVEPYEELKSAFYEHRIEIYDYKPFIEEMTKLEYDRLNGKIDHPVAGSKDVSDAVAGVIWGLKTSSLKTPMEGVQGVNSMKDNEYNWVSPLIPAEEVDIDRVKRNGDDDELWTPIMFG